MEEQVGKCTVCNNPFGWRGGGAQVGGKQKEAERGISCLYSGT